MIRIATSNDIASLHAIEQRCFGKYAWDRDMLISEISNTYSHVVAYTNTDDIVVGYVSARLMGDTVEIGNIAVLPSHRRQGIATALLQFISDFALNSGACYIMLEVDIDNLSAIALYQQYGYDIVATRRDYYPQGRYSSRDAYTCIYQVNNS